MSDIDRDALAFAAAEAMDEPFWLAAIGVDAILPTVTQAIRTAEQRVREQIRAFITSSRRNAGCRPRTVPHDPPPAARSRSRRTGAGRMSTLHVTDGPKMLRETLCLAQSALNEWARQGRDVSRAPQHVARLGRLIDECDRLRPLGPDGKHGDRHTPHCGCEGAA